MFEIQGSYLHRGFMMAPTFWKIQLKKYNPNIDTLLTDETRHFLDNVITSAEQIFGETVKEDIKDGTMPNQYKKITTTFDSSRKTIHPDISIKPLKYTFNFASLIENYYDLGVISQSSYLYEITNDIPPISSSINLENLKSLDDKLVIKNDVILAYQGSGAYTAWQNGAFVTTDKCTNGTSSLYCRIRGPFDTIPNTVGQSLSGRYIRIEGYPDLSFNKQRDILTETIGTKKYLSLKTKQTAVVYTAKPKFNNTDCRNLSFTSLFNVPTNSTLINFIDGYNNESQLGIKLFGQFTKYSNSEPEGDLILTLIINSQTKTFTINNFISGVWCAIVISISNEFKQCGAYIYSIKDDPSDISNHNDFIKIYENISSIQISEFDLDQYYSLPTSNLLITNIRLFNTMLKENEHDFILSQQFIKDESMILLIDNCRPQIAIPYIAKNR
jgi:hypothetical protein